MHKTRFCRLKYTAGAESPGYKYCVHTGCISCCSIHLGVPDIQCLCGLDSKLIGDIKQCGRIRLSRDTVFLPLNMVKHIRPEDFLYYVYRLPVRFI